MRKLIAALLGGIVFFAWGAIAHMFLGLGDMGVHYGTPYSATLAALKQEAPEGGLVMMPTTSRANMMNEAAAKQLQTESAGQGSAFIVYSPGGNPGSVDMGPNLGKQFATDFLSALLAAWVLALGAFGFGKRVAISAVLGLFAWMTVALPDWNWYLFPLDYTLGLMAKYVVGWAIAGAAMAWWLGRGESRA
jgi:hypothetical protein